MTQNSQMKRLVICVSTISTMQMKPHMEMGQTLQVMMITHICCRRTDLTVTTWMMMRMIGTPAQRS